VAQLVRPQTQDIMYPWISPTEVQRLVELAVVTEYTG
jgi:hypothetical protein